MPLSIQTTKYKLLAVALTVALVVCSVLHPMQARAASTDLDYIETTEDIGTIKAQIVALPAAALAIVLGIIGFIALTYVVARNVSVPIEYSPGASFWDKCQELGQYCFDNATQALAPVFASVKQFVDDNPQLGTWGALGAFTALNVTKFFTAISAWLSSTFVGDMTATAAGLIDTAKRSEVAWADYGPMGTYAQVAEYPYLTDMTAALIQYDVNMSQIFGYYYVDFVYGVGYYGKYDFYQFLPGAAGYTLLISELADGSVTWRLKKVSGSNLIELNSDDNVGSIMRRVQYKYYLGSSRPGTAPTYADITPNRFGSGAMSVLSAVTNGALYLVTAGYPGFNPRTPSLRDPVSKVLSLAILAGMHVALYLAVGSGGISIPLDSDDLQWITEIPAAAYPPATQARDTILNPGESVDIDLGHIADTLGGISEQVDAIRDGLEAGSTLELLKLLLSLDNTDTLTQTAVATSSDPNIEPTPVYPIPGLSNVWKYVRYMFSTLGGWITYVGNCLQAVTIGEGGLSWIFYGAFIFIVCGGFIGKLLL